MLALLARRLWLVLALAALAGLTAWAMTRGGVETYERTTVFVLRPAAQLEDGQIPDAVRGIAQQDSQLVHTVARVIETDTFLQSAFEDALDRDPIEGYELGASISPGSDVIEVSISGPEAEVLDELAVSFADEAGDWVRDVYRAYTLDLLEIRAPDEPISASAGQTIGFAVVLGLMLGLGVVFAESKARERTQAAVPIALAEPPPAPPVEEEPPRVRRVEKRPRASASGSGYSRPAEDRPRTRRPGK